MAKRGAVSAFTWVWVITILFILIPFYFVLNAIVERGIDVSINTHDLEHYLLLNRIFYSTNSIFYYDPYTGRTNLEEIDITRFNEDTLKNLFDKESNTRISFKLILNSQELYYNKNLYDFIEQVYAKSEEYEMVTKNKVVLVKYPDGREEKGLLTVNLGFCKTTTCG